MSVRSAILTIKNCIDQERNEKDHIIFETFMEVIDNLFGVKPKVAISEL